MNRNSPTTNGDKPAHPYSLSNRTPHQCRHWSPVCHCDRVTGFIPEHLQTHLQAIRPVRPNQEVDQWAFQVLQQFGLKESNIAGAVTDAGTDAKAGLGQVLNWEWYVPHMLNCVFVDGAGTAPDRTRSKNPFARQLVDNSRRVI